MDKEGQNNVDWICRAQNEPVAIAGRERDPELVPNRLRLQTGVGNLLNCGWR